MISSIENRFVPNYAVPPGELLDEELIHRGMSQVELAKRTGLTQKTINEIIKAKAPITPDTALKLERVINLPADYWLSLERLYQEALARTREHQNLETDVDWLKFLPIKEMCISKWVRRHPNRVDQLKEILKFFGIASVEQWEVLWGSLEVAYRRSLKFQGNAYAISAWLRRGEILAQELECSPFDESRFREVLAAIKALTREPQPGIFVPRLQNYCASAGVAVVFVPELPQTHVSGATRWLNKDKAVIQLSLRYKSDDHLWFTFFHEAGHVIKHGKKSVFLEGKGMREEKEQEETEADNFARNFLVPTDKFSEFVKLNLFSKRAIIKFARQIGIAPGIIVGQLQHDGLLPFTHCNGLKRRFRWHLNSRG